jgi:hypothetical protein
VNDNHQLGTDFLCIRKSDKQLIFEGKVLIWGKDKKEIEEKLNQWKGVSINMTMNTSRNPNTDTGIRVNNTLVKQVGKFIYMGSKINSEGKTD